MSTITNAIKTFIADEDGVTAIEYGLLAALVGVAIVGAAGSLGDGLNALFEGIVAEFANF
ncbi:MAG: Flp family type IVb pilin [Massilia sp.]|nr:MAG: Flp family type IVb pilin [Massilia sp.]